MSPILKQAINENKRIVSHDEFKSDLYSLGLIFLELYMEFLQKKRSEIYKIISSPEKAYEEAKKYNINKYLFGGDHLFLTFDEAEKYTQII